MNWSVAFVIAALILSILAAIWHFWEKPEGSPPWPRFTLLSAALACYFASILAGHLTK